MRAAPVAAITDLFSLDALAARGQALVDYARSDWLGFTFWSIVWTGSFCVTFLLLRMLFTRWGDTHVTRKTMAVSLLAHFLLGLLSTRLALPRDESADRATEVIVRPIRRVEPGPSELAPGELTDRPAVWERPPEFVPADLERSPVKPPELADVKPPERPTPEQSTLDVQLPELPPEKAPAASAAAQRGADRRTRGPAPAGSPATEETAAARDESSPGEGQPRRLARPGAASTRAEPQRIPRDAPRDLDITLPDPVGKRTDSELTNPRVEIARGAADSAVPRADAPTARPANDGDDVPASREANPGTSGKPAFTRARRESSQPGAAATLDRERRGAPQPAPDTGTALAARSGVGEPSVPGPAPEVIRPDVAGIIGKDSGKVPAPYRLRGLPQRKKFAIEMGATEESERAVEASLAWLARHQHPRGYWEPIEATLGKEPDQQKFDNLAERQRSGLEAESGLTALALLAFLGANYTHEDNRYAENVSRGLQWLMAQQGADGFLGGRANKYARMYCHGMATIALGEAYGMTRDPALKEPLARAIAYIVEHQNSGDGGWRYMKGQTGDMSMFGWQLMALKSAHTAGIRVPRESVERAIDFLLAHGDDQKTRGQSRYGGLAGYRRGERVKPAMTAESLFCKQMLGLKRDDPAVNEAVDYLLRNLPRRSQQDLYYWYYGTLAMYHSGGEPWRRWNQALRDNLVADQRTEGDLAGSWNPRAPWGDYGGRVFSTALSTLCLEVYYRFLPLYQLGGAGEPEEK